jgi:hypothetical protein
VAAKHGIYRTAQRLRLDSSALKRRMRSGVPTPAPPAFVELLPVSGPPPGCVIEVEHPVHGKLRLELKGWRTADISGVVRQLWSSRA